MRWTICERMYCVLCWRYHRRWCTFHLRFDQMWKTIYIMSRMKWQNEGRQKQNWRRWKQTTTITVAMVARRQQQQRQQFIAKAYYVHVTPCHAPQPVLLLRCCLFVVHAFGPIALQLCVCMSLLCVCARACNKLFYFIIITKSRLDDLLIKKERNTHVQTYCKSNKIWDTATESETKTEQSKYNLKLNQNETEKKKKKNDWKQKKSLTTRMCVRALFHSPPIAVRESTE